jgi:hypothetical protein
VTVQRSEQPPVAFARRTHHAPVSRRPGRCGVEQV